MLTVLDNWRTVDSSRRAQFDEQYARAGEAPPPAAKQTYQHHLQLAYESSESPTGTMPRRRTCRPCMRRLLRRLLMAYLNLMKEVGWKGGFWFLTLCNKRKMRQRCRELLMMVDSLDQPTAIQPLSHEHIKACALFTYTQENGAVRYAFLLPTYFQKQSIFLVT